MIRNTTIQLAKNLAMGLTQDKMVFKPKPGTLLAEMMGPLQFGEYSTLEEFVEAISTPDDGYTSHTKLIEELTGKIAPQIQRHIHRVKNVIIPEIENYYNHISQDLEQTVGLELILRNQYKVSPFYMPEVIKGYIGNDLSKYPVTNGVSTRSEVSFGDDKTYEDLLKIMGNNSHIKDWLNRTDQLLVMMVWYSHFIGLPVSNRPEEMNIKYGRNIDTLPFPLSLDAWTLVYILADSLINNPDKVTDLQNNTLAEFNQKLKNSKNMAGNQLVKLVKRYKSLEDMNSLVLSKDTLTKTIYVVGEVYNAFINEGGNDEVLLGVLVSNQIYINKTKILEQQETLKNAWDTFISLNKINALESQRFQRKEILKIHFLNSLETLTSLEDEYQNRIQAQFKETVIGIFMNELSNVKDKDYDDLTELSVRLIAKTRFYFTDSYDIIMDIEQAQTSTDNPRGAALIATIQYIVRFMVDNGKLEKIK